jgi:hypothetical protein
MQAKLKVVGIGNQGIMELNRTNENAGITVDFISYEITTLEKLNEALLVFVIFSPNDDIHDELEQLKKLKSSIAKVGIAIGTESKNEYSNYFNAYWPVDSTIDQSVTKFIASGIQMLIELGNTKGPSCIDMADVIGLLENAKKMQLVYVSQSCNKGIVGLTQKILDIFPLNKEEIQTIMLLYYLPNNYKLEFGEIGCSLKELSQSFNNIVDIAWNICQDELAATLLNTKTNELCCIGFFC